MRLHEFITEGRMGDLYDTLMRIRQLSRADVEIDERSKSIWIGFSLDGNAGIIRLTPRSTKYNRKSKSNEPIKADDLEDLFASRIRAAAYSENRGGGKISFEEAKHLLQRRQLSNNAIKILTNPEAWSVVSLTHGNHLVPMPPKSEPTDMVN